MVQKEKSKYSNYLKVSYTLFKYLNKIIINHEICGCKMKAVIQKIYTV